ncbi:transcriptional regulatory protein QseF [Peptococcaceae bacterium CEB3]|nr:transcriptional regulatory protein QseF [Peptococcaceae bacterium CEB3]
MELRVQDYVIQIDFVDRLGLAYEIFEVFKNRKINLVGMEATSNERMLIKCQTVREYLQALMNELITIEGVKALELKDYLLCEQREYELSTILNSVSEGIIAVNNKGVITHLNEVACRTFFCSKEEVIGKDVDEVFQAKAPILQTLKSGQPYSLKEVKMQKDHRSLHFLTSGLPIFNAQGQIIGGVATITDFSQVEEIVSKVGAKKRLTTFEDIVYQGPAMSRLVETAKAVAKGNSTILLRGESGTGKELFARAIHMESNRASGPFIAINCGALPDSLLESELFGYDEGAFTGAIRGGKKGLFEQAHGGTLFLDEIGEVSAPVQVRLLRVLQENTVRRVGGSREIPVEVRIIAATHRNLEEMIQAGEFREDLYYRLNVFPLRILPLRERREDIPFIAQHLIRKICLRLERPEFCLTKDTVEFLMKQDWPGNVRQLENVLERMINIMEIEGIKAEDFYSWMSLPRPAGRERQAAGKERGLESEGGSGRTPEGEIEAEIRDEMREAIARRSGTEAETAGLQHAGVASAVIESIETRSPNTAPVLQGGMEARGLYTAPDIVVAEKGAGDSAGQAGALPIRVKGENVDSGAGVRVLHVMIPFAGKWPPLKTIVNEVEKQVLMNVLAKHPSSRKAGRVLGVSSTTVLNKINAYGIVLENDED